jgi:hypothetical protein
MPLGRPWTDPARRRPPGVPCCAAGQAQAPPGQQHGGLRAAGSAGTRGAGAAWGVVPSCPARSEWRRGAKGPRSPALAAVGAQDGVVGRVR